MTSSFLETSSSRILASSSSQYSFSWYSFLMQLRSRAYKVCRLFSSWLYSSSSASGLSSAAGRDCASQCRVSLATFSMMQASYSVLWQSSSRACSQAFCDLVLSRGRSVSISSYKIFFSLLYNSVNYSSAMIYYEPGSPHHIQYIYSPAMPLYEMMIIARCSTPEHLATTASNISRAVWSSGGVVRNVKILTDRILPKQLKANDGKPAVLARFSQVLFDGSPKVMEDARKEALNDKTIMKVHFFKVKDFYSHVQEYHKDIGSQIDRSSKKLDTARRIAILREEGVLV